MVRYSDHQEGHGPEFFRHACRYDLEGTIAKRRDRPYRSGRSSDWRKIKCHKSDEFVVIGFTRRMASAGYAYTYTSRTLGQNAGFLTGWLYFFGFFCFVPMTMAGVGGFTRDLIASEWWHGIPGWSWFVIFLIGMGNIHRIGRMPGAASDFIEAEVPHDGEDLYGAEFQRPLALAIGNEGSGLSDALIERADIRVTIPMATGTESLNAAAAAAVALFECVRRQRAGSNRSLPRTSTRS